MELLALLSSSDDQIIPDVKDALGKFTVYPLKTLNELEELYRNIPLNLLLIDVTTVKMSLIEEFLNRFDDKIVLLITPEKPDRFTKENLPRCVFETIEARSVKADLPTLVERALERQRFRNELRLLRESRDVIQPSRQMQAYEQREPVSFRREPVTPRYESVHSGRYIQEKVILNFAKMLTVSFDMSKLLDHFMDSVMEIARVSRMSVMIRDRDRFLVKTQVGLDPYLAENLQLGTDSALVKWLARTGRLMQKPSAYPDTASVDIRKEMDLLQCCVSFPMMYKGRLIGILNIDSKITEEPFYREELEIIYVLCNYLAAAVKDIDHYHQLWYQKEFTKNILTSMTSGMIAIDRDEKITVFNQQASDILNLDSSKIIGSDLRELPSPLGDILFETMKTGTSYRRHEVTIHPSNMPLGINSYRLMDEHQQPTGAGIVFSDLSDSKKLQEQSMRAKNLEAVNDLMAKIAHEVRNPLTSIQTYTQLLNEKYSDDDLQKFFASTVSDSINRLNVLIDKLITFSSKQDYTVKTEDVNVIMSEAVEFISRNIPQTHSFTAGKADKVFYINADKKLLIKAICYLVLSIADHTPDGVPISMNVVQGETSESSVAIALTFSGSGSFEKGKQGLMKPLLDIQHLGTELNVPISHKIIEGHGGSLDLIQKDGETSFLISLPVTEKKTEDMSVRRGHVGGN